ncbi:pyocin knob domain-containing protein [Aquitalea sp. ASV15]|uniref:pyocin knob domain-containing protein n=1 Tax=Aquitalea sp. ASV15 TaxID=2795104 RepID=UPI0018EE40BF|nr:pyocin knob domain-containing protein [Aquitalea sp. ASV15]
MHKINTPDSLFHDGDPSTGALGTIVTAAWLNALQGELATVIEAAGIKLEADKSDQLKLAIGKMISTAGMLPAASRVVGSAAELDALRANGFYTVFNANADGHVLHIQHAGSTNYAVQIMFGQWGRVPTTAGAGFSWRALINGAWNEWQQIFHNGNSEHLYRFRGSLGSNVDLNTIDISGIYQQTTDRWIPSGKNWPSTFSGMLTVHSAYQGNMIFQYYQTYVGNAYFRSYYADVWTGWRMIISPVEFPSHWDLRLNQRMTFQY